MVEREWEGLWDRGGLWTGGLCGRSGWVSEWGVSGGGRDVWGEKMGVWQVCGRGGDCFWVVCG